MIKGQPLSPVIEYRTFRQKHDKLTMFTIIVRTVVTKTWNDLKPPKTT